MAERFIPESELFLVKDANNQPRVYHLNLAPQDIADIVILVGDPERVPKISRHFSKIEVEIQKREFVTHTGYYKGKRMTVIGTGIGVSNIDIVMNELDALVNIDLATRLVKEQLKKLTIVRLGSSGALQSDTELNSFVAGEYGLGLDVSLNFYRRNLSPQEQELTDAIYKHLGEEFLTHIRPYVAQAAPNLVKLFADSCQVGITATSPGFFGAQGRHLRSALIMPNFVDHLAAFQYQNRRIANFEMEASAIYGHGRLLGHDCLAVNLIIANRANKTFTDRLYSAVDEMIEMALIKLSQVNTLE